MRALDVRRDSLRHTVSRVTDEHLPYLTRCRQASRVEVAMISIGNLCTLHLRCYVIYVFQQSELLIVRSASHHLDRGKADILHIHLHRVCRRPCVRLKC